MANAAVITATGRPSRVGFRHGLALPFGALFVAYALARSTWTTLRKNGITWRGHHYPLQDLKAHARTRDTWLHAFRQATRQRRRGRGTSGGRRDRD
jgi:hypothetical protein